MNWIVIVDLVEDTIVRNQFLNWCPGQIIGTKLMVLY